MIRQNTRANARLTGLKIATLLFAVIVGLALGASERLVFGHIAETTPSSSEIAAERQKAIAAMPRLPVDIDEKLEAARYPQLAPVNLVADPFTGKNSLSSASGVATQRVSTNAAATTSPSVPSLPDINTRIDEWRKNYRAAKEAKQPIPDKTRIYLLSELKPIGRTVTKNITYAWFRLEIEQRNFPATVGAKFYDAQLISITDNGASFRLSNGTVRTLAWIQKDNSTSSGQPLTKIKSETEQRPRQNNEERQSAGEMRQVAAMVTSEATDQALIALESETIESVVAERGNQGEKEREEIFMSHAQVSKIKVSDSLPKDTPGTSPATQGKEGSNPKPQPSNPARPQVNKPSSPAAPVSAEKSRPRTVKSEKDSRNDREVAFATATKSEPSVTHPTRQQKEEDRVEAPQNQPTPQTETTATEKESNLSPLCDPNYKAELIGTDFTSPITLGNLVDTFNKEFSAGIVLDADVQDIPVRLAITNVPWTQFLRIILDLNDLGQVCLDGRLVGIAKRSKLAQMEEQRKKSEPIVQEIFHLRYLQPTAGGRVNLAGQAQGGQGATIQSLEDAIRAILQKGDARADVRRVPGRNELLVAATREQIDRVRELIARVDRPGYQILITALVYTANENRLKDVGSQVAVVVGNATGTNLGGLTSLPPGTQQSSGTGTGNTQQPGGLNPGGIPSLATGMQQPSSGLTASSPNATFGVTTVVGTAQFSYQLTLAQRQGVVNIQSRPFGVVTDGDTFDLAAGTQIPVVTSSIAGGAVTQTGNVQFIEASRIARITPQVAETEDGKAGFVTLTVQLENNVVDTSLGTFNGLPGVNRQSLQTVLRLRDGETAVIGGLSADSVSNAVAKVPGLGSIPIVGNLFKRKTNQENRDRLYFAITVKVIPQDSPLINIPTPADALTTPPPPPRSQKPSPYEKKP